MIWLYGDGPFQVEDRGCRTGYHDRVRATLRPHLKTAVRRGTSAKRPYAAYIADSNRRVRYASVYGGPGGLGPADRSRNAQQKLHDQVDLTAM